MLTILCVASVDMNVPEETGYYNGGSVLYSDIPVVSSWSGYPLDFSNSSDLACSMPYPETLDTDKDDTPSPPPTDTPNSYGQDPRASRSTSLKLRTASRKSKNSGRRTSIAKEEAQARRCHNMVEKNYRNRLKIHFETLLAVLPIAQTGNHDEKWSALSLDQFLSKGQVLDVARDHILELERKVELQAAESNRRLEEMERLKAILCESRYGHMDI